MDDKRALLVLCQRLNLDIDIITSQATFRSGELRILNLSNQKLSFLPHDSFSDFKNLLYLYIQKNELVELPQGLFDGLTNLQELSLSENYIATLPSGIFNDLKNLQGLYLQKNSLEMLPSGLFDNLIRLDRLYLNNNQLDRLPHGIFDNLKALTTLYLVDNPLPNTLNRNMVGSTVWNVAWQKYVKDFHSKLDFTDSSTSQKDEIIPSVSATPNENILPAKILKLIQQFRPDIPVQLSRIAQLANGGISDVEVYLKQLVDSDKSLGEYLELEQVFIRSSQELSDELIEVTLKSITTSNKGGLETLQICPSCKETQSVLIRQCTNCQENLAYCHICKQGFTENQSQLDCPHCSNYYHRSHLFAYIQAEGKCPVCREGLTLGQFQ